MVMKNISPQNLNNFVIQNRTLPPLSKSFLEVIISNYGIKDDEFANSFDLHYPFSKTSMKLSRIKSAKVLNDCEEKKVVEMAFETNESFCNHMPGDTIGILPKNDPKDVDFILEYLQLTEISNYACEIVVIKGTTKKGVQKPTYLPNKTTCKQLFKHFLNIRAIPKKVFLRTLAQYNKNELEKQFLETLCSKEGTNIYNELVLHNNMNVLEVLKLCPSSKIPLSIFIEHLPRLLPRPYSIANSAVAGENQIKIIFSIKKEAPGITTKYLETFIEKDLEKNYIQLYYREPTKFRFTEEDYSKNLILISVGCALSPFLGFLQHRSQLLMEKCTLGICWLFTGFKCKNSSLYSDFIQSQLKNGNLNRYFECWSRDSEAKYKYVQNAIKENKEMFIDLLVNDNTIIFICADGAGISKDIETTIKECLMDNLDCDTKEANSIIKNYKSSNKYREDTWL